MENSGEKEIKLKKNFKNNNFKSKNYFGNSEESTVEVSEQVLNAFLLKSSTESEGELSLKSKGQIVQEWINHTNGWPNAILDALEEGKALKSALQYDSLKKLPNSADFYDIKFLLHLLCHICDHKNRFDGSKVIFNGWIYLISRGISLEDEILRSCSFLAYKNLILNLQASTAHQKQDIKIWLHFLWGVKRGVAELGVCKISHLLSTWIISAWAVVRQPSHPLFKKVTSVIFNKPFVELSILPDFLPFYNESDGERDTREWILNVLFYGLKSEEDWRIAQKLPVIKCICSSYIFEKVQHQRTIIKILRRGAKIPKIAQELIDKYSIPLWVANISTNSNAVEKDLRDLINNLNNESSSSSIIPRELLFNYVNQKKNWIKEEIC